MNDMCVQRHVLRISRTPLRKIYRVSILAISTLVLSKAAQQRRTSKRSRRTKLHFALASWSAAVLRRFG